MVLPGNQNEAKCVDRVQEYMNGWKLGNVIWSMERGMTSEENRRNLQRAGGPYILGEKLRGININEEALNRGCRFKIIKENLHFKKVFVGEAQEDGDLSLFSTKANILGKRVRIRK